MLNKSLVVGLTATVFSLAGCSRKDLLTFVIERNEAATEPIQTVQYTVSWISDIKTREGVRHDEGTGEVKIKGDLRLCRQECNASIEATGWKQTRTPSMVLNDKYLAYWPSVGNGYIYQNDHPSVHELAGDSVMRRDTCMTPDMPVLDIAFGGEKGTTFRQMMGLHPDQIRWTAEETKLSGGEKAYLIKRYSPYMNDPAKPDAVWTIDPQRGYLVTEAVFYGKAGDVWITRKIECEEFDGGVWFPVSYEEHRYDAAADGQEPQSPDVTTIYWKDVSINDEIPDDVFVLESILPKEHRESTTLFRRGLDGNTEAYVYVDGGYMLRDDWLKLKQQ